MKITCIFCKKFTSLKREKGERFCPSLKQYVSALSPSCPDVLVDGTFYCPFKKMFTDFRTCAKYVRRIKARNKDCTGSCPIRHIIKELLRLLALQELRDSNPPPLVKRGPLVTLTKRGASNEV